MSFPNFSLLVLCVLPTKCSTNSLVLLNTVPQSSQFKFKFVVTGGRSPEEEARGEPRALFWQEGDDRAVALPFEDALSLDVVVDWEGDAEQERIRKETGGAKSAVEGIVAQEEDAKPTTRQMREMAFLQDLADIDLEERELRSRPRPRPPSRRRPGGRRVRT